ncbi:WXG100 family type VII secretion target [Rhodococcus sovatensis]|uniref:WXG100 family type VII secretion target n=1 Tax=Rhodococcus sovatensis TaxID=1805840 RepID=A0ABZ2PKI9_9NOCA
MDVDPAALSNVAHALTSIADELQQGLTAMSTDVEKTIGDHWLGAAANDHQSRWSALHDGGVLVVRQLEELINGLSLSGSDYQSTESANTTSIRHLNLD